MFATTLRRVIVQTALLTSFLTPVSAQWLNFRDPDTPRTKDGQPDLTAQVPRTYGGKPDLSGVWAVEPPQSGEIERLYGARLANGPGIVVGDDIRDLNKYFLNLFIDFKPGDEPITPATRATELTRREAGGDDPYTPAHCLPFGLPWRYAHFRPFKIYQAPKELVIVYELDGAYRQIHTDGRPLPTNPFPSWMGYSTAQWDGDTLVVDSAGYNDKTTLPGLHLHSEALHIRERFHRRDFGHMDLELTVEDPVTLTRPVTVTFTEHLIPDSDILENFCAEGERDSAFMAAQSAKDRPKEAR